MQKELFELSSIEYAMHEWHNTSEPNDVCPVYVRSRLRTPQESVKAKADFEEWMRIAEQYRRWQEAQ